MDLFLQKRNKSSVNCQISKPFFINYIYVFAFCFNKSFFLEVTKCPGNRWSGNTKKISKVILRHIESNQHPILAGFLKNVIGKLLLYCFKIKEFYFLRQELGTV